MHVKDLNVNLISFIYRSDLNVIRLIYFYGHKGILEIGLFKTKGIENDI